MCKAQTWMGRTKDLQLLTPMPDIRSKELMERRTEYRWGMACGATATASAKAKHLM